VFSLSQATRQVDPLDEHIDIACMDCGKRSIEPRDANAPAKAVLYMTHCGCKMPFIIGRAYYMDADSRRIEATRPPLVPRHD